MHTSNEWTSGTISFESVHRRGEKRIMIMEVRKHCAYTLDEEELAAPDVLCSLNKKNLLYACEI